MNLLDTAALSALIKPRLLEGRRKAALQETRDTLLLPLLDCCPAFDTDAALIWGAAGRQHPIIDTQIAAIALVHDLAVVTRNIRDFAPLGVATINPWETTA